ncbi:hypothetical protein E2C01_077511 [Portunus trituberculatus]|uniref:Uncharacterized protein n=1 Tax=Portunus trituberculatus TaxID=210409 RepID=A0A5B7IKG2_PORTR|nr:hypothetical protein [Portunus trituberculatus]
MYCFISCCSAVKRSDSLISPSFPSLPAADVVPPWFTSNISIDEHGDRKADYTLLDMNSFTGIFEMISFSSKSYNSDNVKTVLDVGSG